MSGSRAKYTRRQIRRAFGDVAQQKIDAQDTEIATLRARLATETASLQGRVTETAAAMATRQAAEDQAIREEYRAVMRRPFWGRMKWLLVGR